MYALAKDIKEEMEKNINLMLVDGDFSKEEANELLTSLISYKVNYHSMKNFSDQERFGRSHQHSLQRIKELRSELNALHEWLAKHKVNERISIRSSINISTTDD